MYFYIRQKEEKENENENEKEKQKQKQKIIYLLQNSTKTPYMRNIIESNTIFKGRFDHAILDAASIKETTFT